MSSGGTIPFSAATSPAAGPDDDVECRACYGVVVACVSLLLFCVVAATAGVLKAGVVTGTAVLFFGVIGWLVPAGASTRRPYAFAYECGPADAEGGGKPGGGALCAVCLEDVRRGEAVRRLPACGHLFHKDCVDTWLHAHTTCPLCRCDLVLRKGAATTVTAAAAAQSSRDVLPPV
ncbi:putative RING-H2 finger protein ATL69 [Panicum hallii]|uniref:putative RING-H2 finger protein ATL69 n=1 Tax=Panicum hallii TaxID=206008 RepID=UPI000DF4D92E|nr:putative RING-H2 finger protein ATL69 [Panicum hallii]